MSKLTPLSVARFKTRLPYHIGVLFNGDTKVLLDTGSQLGVPLTILSGNSINSVQVRSGNMGPRINLAKGQYLVFHASTGRVSSMSKLSYKLYRTKYKLGTVI